MASNAKPLWTQLPSGALKLQVLAELAVLVQLSSQELIALWEPAAAHVSPMALPGQRAAALRNPQQPLRRRTGRVLPASRADHAARMLLGNTELWAALSSEDHCLLCELQAPHGPLFAWLEAQLHEHGPLPWQALRMEMQGRPDEDLALRLMADPAVTNEASAQALPELRDLLNRMLIERIKEQETQAIDASRFDPTALDRYRELQARRQQLEKSQSGAIIRG
jgi:DNA primase